MENLLLTINPQDPLWIAIAFAFGLVVRIFGLPPLIGFLIAGFFLHAVGAESGEFLSEAADLGVTLLLFTIGLKLKISSLLRYEVWGVAGIHMTAVTVLLTAFVMFLAQLSLPLFGTLDLSTAIFIGFALSFSSTVFAVKILEEKGHLKRSGRYSRTIHLLNRAGFGPRKTATGKGDIGVCGETLLGLAKGECMSGTSVREARELMRSLLEPHLGPRPLKSRELFRRWRPRS